MSKKTEIDLGQLYDPSKNPKQLLGMNCPCGTTIDTKWSKGHGVVEIDCRCGRIYIWDSTTKQYEYKITRKLARIYDLE